LESWSKNPGKFLQIFKGRNHAIRAKSRQLKEFEVSNHWTASVHEDKDCASIGEHSPLFLKYLTRPARRLHSQNWLTWWMNGYKTLVKRISGIIPLRAMRADPPRKGSQASRRVKISSWSNQSARETKNESNRGPYKRSLPKDLLVFWSFPDRGELPSVITIISFLE